MLKFEWDKGNIGKIQRRFLISDIELFFYQEVLLFFDLKHSDLELRFIAVGNGPLNKPIFVSFTFRLGSIRVVSARHMRKKELEKYEKVKKTFESEN